MDVGIEKTLLNRVFGILAMSRDPMRDPKQFCAMAFAKLIEEGSIDHFGDRNKLLVTDYFAGIACAGSRTCLLMRNLSCLWHCRLHCLLFVVALAMPSEPPSECRPVYAK